MKASVSRFCVDENMTMKDAIAVIEQDLCRCVIVINAHRKVVGVFSEGDVLRMLLQETDVHTPLKKLIKPSFLYLNTRDVKKAFDLVRTRGITLIPVIAEDFTLTGVITIHDVLNSVSFSGERTDGIR